MKTTVHDCKLIELPKISERKGAITPIYGGVHVPFDVARVYYLYDVPGGESRGGHAHRELQQLIVSVMGAFDVVLDDGKERRRVHLDRAYYGLHIQANDLEGTGKFLLRRHLPCIGIPSL